METSSPRYLMVAESLRRPILEGRLLPGTRLPSRAQLAVRHRVSEQVSRHALRLLMTEGLVESRPGSGYYVRRRPMAHRLPRTGSDTGPMGTFLGEHLGAMTIAAAPAEAARLNVRVGESLYRTRHLARSEEIPVMVHTSWEPTALTRGTNHSPLHATTGENPVDRLARAGTVVDRVLECVTVRPAHEPEADLLGTEPGQAALVIERTHFSGQRPVETSHLVAAPEGCELVYRLSLSPRAPSPRTSP